MVDLTHPLRHVLPSSLRRETRSARSAGCCSAFRRRPAPVTRDPVRRDYAAAMSGRFSRDKWDAIHCGLGKYIDKFNDNSPWLMGTR